jgi:glycosyltransferase involved in cell wall biosynthesis
LQCREETVPAPGIFIWDVYVYPTRRGYRLTMLEANACNLPVSRPHAPMTEFVEHGVNGRHVAVEVRHAGMALLAAGSPNLQDLVAQMRWYVGHRRMGLMKREARSYADATS